MAVRVVRPDDKRALKEFVGLERQLLGHFPHYWQLTTKDTLRVLSGLSPQSEGIERALFIAEEGKPVVRCAAIRNRRWQEAKDDLAGHIGYFAAAKGAEPEVAELLAAAEAWLGERGCDRAIAPSNGNAYLGIALRSDAFDAEPPFPLPWTPSYYPAYLEQAGYRPSYPLWIYEVDFASDAYREAARRALAEPACVVRRLDKSRWLEELELLRRGFNEGFTDEWEFHPFTRAENEEVWKDLKGIFDERMLLFAEVDGELAGFCLSLLDWTALWRSLRGRMGPLQILRLMRGWRKAEGAGVLAIAALPAFRGRRVGATLLANAYAGLEEMGFGKAIYYYVNEDNHSSRRLAESFGGSGRALYHCYDKPLG